MAKKRDTSLEEAQSVQILGSMIRDAKEATYPSTYVGIISDVRQGPKFDETGERLYVIKVAQGFVYMSEAEAPEEFRNRSAEDLRGEEIAFKPISVHDGPDGAYISVSNRFCTDMYRLAMQRGTEMEGTITAVYPDKDNIDNAYMIVQHRGDRLLLPMKEFSCFGIPAYEAAMLNRKIPFVVIGVDEDGHVLISKAKIEEKRRDAVIEELQSHPEGVVAMITRIKKFGAYLTYHGVPLILRNKDFSNDYTPVGAIKAKGDMLLVNLAEISEHKRIFVKPVEKYKAPTSIYADTFRQGQIVLGMVNGSSSSAVYVRIAPGLDCQCVIPEERVPALGEKVRVKIRSVREDHGLKVRGYIVGGIQPARWKRGVSPVEPKEYLFTAGEKPIILEDVPVPKKKEKDPEEVKDASEPAEPPVESELDETEDFDLDKEIDVEPGKEGE